MIWAVTWPEALPGEAVRINRLLSVADVLLLRKPGWSTNAYALLLEQIAPRYRVKIMIHEQPSLVVEYKLRGLHVSEYTRKASAVEKYAGLGVPLSTSIHTPHCPGDMWNHLLLGPVFDSISKPGYVGQGAQMKGLPANALAIGGVDVSRVVAIRAMGFGGAAVLGALWQEHVDAAEVYTNIKRAWDMGTVFLKDKTL